MREILLSKEQMFTILRRTPTRIATLTDGLAPDQLDADPAFGGWSANEVLAHMRACGDVWGGNSMKIFTQDKETVRGINPRAWIKKTDYLEQEFQANLSAFSTRRTDLMDVLESSRPED